MQFNSYIFIMAFLPIIVTIYYLANKFSYVTGKIVLIVAGVFFYAYANWHMIIVLGFSIIMNYTLSRIIVNKHLVKNCKQIVVLSICLNVIVLLFFKYTGFLLTTINTTFCTELRVPTLVLPLGISFFTFQQIAYAVSVYREDIKRVELIDYLSYILFFPKLIMGPLMQPDDFINQINDKGLKDLDWDNLTCGVKIFCLGLFKKMLIADVFASAVDWGFESIGAISSTELLLVMLFYTFQIYFDFSGYSDMAVGSSLMLNITLPINFDSPYKALSIRDFWSRWHISLTSFFTKYIYIPLGGNRRGTVRTMLNIMIVFLVSGLWHGDNWTFILWGFFHGLFCVIDRLVVMFERDRHRVLKIFRWIFSFTIVNILWLLFRSESIGQWKMLLCRIVAMQDVSISQALMDIFYLPEITLLFQIVHLRSIIDSVRGSYMILYTITASLICFVPENNYRRLKKNSLSIMIICAILLVWSILHLGGESIFIYNGF